MTPEEMKVIGGVCLPFECHFGQDGENIAVLCFAALTTNFFLYQPECEVIHLDENIRKSEYMFLYVQSLSSFIFLKLKVLMPENF